jgi:hypothetical protein
MGRNVSDAARGVSGITAHLGDVATVAASTRSCAAQSDGASRALAAATDRLRALVDRFRYEEHPGAVGAAPPAARPSVASWS